MDDLIADLEATPSNLDANLVGLVAEHAALQSMLARRWEATRDRYRSAGWELPSYDDLIRSLRRQR